MNELPIERFHKAIQATHGCDSTFTGGQVHVKEDWDGHVVWEGMELQCARLKS